MTIKLGKPKESRREAGKTFLSRLLLLGSGVLVAYRYLPSMLYRNADPKNERPPAVMLIVSGSENKEQGQVMNSRKVLDRCKELGVEFRRYSADADLFQEAEWVRDMQQNGLSFGPPCIVIVDKKGRGHCEEVPASVDDVLTLLEVEYAI